MIFDPDPAARASKLQQDLNSIADGLRQQGANVEVLHDGGDDIHIVAMTINMPCSTAMALTISTALRNFAIASGAEMQDDPFVSDISGSHDVEYSAALAYSVVKQRGKA